MQFEGIYTPLVTPYNADFTCNEDRLAETVDFLIEAGVHGIIVAGTTGEYYAQTMKERVWLMGRVKELIKGRVPMIVGTGAIRTEDSVEYGAQARAWRRCHSGGDPALCLSDRPRDCAACAGD